MCFWNGSSDIQLHSVHHLSLDSRLQVPWETSDTVGEHAIARIFFWSSADAPGKNYSVWPRKIPSCHQSGSFSWTAPSRTPFLTKGHIDVGLLSDQELCDSLSFHRFRDVIWRLFEQQISRIMGVKHVISQLLHCAVLVRGRPTCELSVSQF